MEAPKRLIKSFRRKRNNSKKLAPSTTEEAADKVVKPRENYLSSNGRPMSYSGPSKLSDTKLFEGAPPRYPSSAVHITPFQLDNQDRRRSKRNGERRKNGDNADDDGVHKDQESTTPVALISVRRSERGIAGLQTLREHRELLMEQRLSLPREHPRSIVHHQEQTDKKGRPLAWEPLGHSDSINVRRTDAPTFAVGNDAIEFWDRTRNNNPYAGAVRRRFTR